MRGKLELCQNPPLAAAPGAELTSAHLLFDAFLCPQSCSVQYFSLTCIGFASFFSTVEELWSLHHEIEVKHRYPNLSACLGHIE